MRSLFVRVFVAFWIAFVLMLASLATFTAVTNARPLSHRWLMHSLDLYAGTAVDAYEEGGVSRLHTYLTEIHSDSKISANLIRDDVNVMNTPLPSEFSPLLAQARSEQRSQYSFDSPWLGVVRVVRHEHAYFFVAEVTPVRMFGNFIDPEKTSVRLALVLIISATLCGLLAKSITRPIGSLQKTATAIANGDLAARASPALAGRRDELASLAHDFDRMADRVQLLLDRQQLLLRDISHELRSPLARLALSTELVQRGDLSAAGRMQGDIHALEQMITDLLTLARIDGADRSLRKERIHIGKLVQQIVRDASFEGAATHKTVVQTGVFDRYILAEGALLHSCIENVVRNALKHSPSGGVVEVNLCDLVENNLPTVSITVTDDGPGVPEDSLQQIFDPFFQIASGESHKQSGTGVGLAISKRIAALYGGSSSAKNLAESGFQVGISLPVLS